MCAKSQSQPVKPQDDAANKGVGIELSAEALSNLAGWFDVLIQMDLAIKVRNEVRGKNENTNLQNDSESPKEVN